jgi:hypothetical protein
MDEPMPKKTSKLVTICPQKAKDEHKSALDSGAT